MLLLAEHFISDLNLPSTTVTLVHPRTGFKNLAVYLNTCSLREIKIIVTMVGQADVLDRQVSVQQSLQEFREAINEQDPAILWLLCTPLPWPSDSAAVAHKLHCMTGMLKAFCHGKSTVEYSRATQDFVTVDGLNPAFIQDCGITPAGLQQIHRLVVGKLNCGWLREKYQEFKNLCDL